MSYEDYCVQIFRKGEIINSKSYFNADNEYVTLFTIRMNSVPDAISGGVFNGLYHVKTVFGKFAGYKRIYA